MQAARHNPALSKHSLPLMSALVPPAGRLDTNASIPRAAADRANALRIRRQNAARSRYRPASRTRFFRQYENLPEKTHSTKVSERKRLEEHRQTDIVTGGLLDRGRLRRELLVVVSGNNERVSPPMLEPEGEPICRCVLIQRRLRNP